MEKLKRKLSVGTTIKCISNGKAEVTARVESTSAHEIVLRFPDSTRITLTEKSDVELRSRGKLLVFN